LWQCHHRGNRKRADLLKVNEMTELNFGTFIALHDYQKF